jgi:hypothetical protein
MDTRSLIATAARSAGRRLCVPSALRRTPGQNPTPNSRGRPAQENVAENGERDRWFRSGATNLTNQFVFEARSSRFKAANRASAASASRLGGRFEFESVGLSAVRIELEDYSAARSA